MEQIFQGEFAHEERNYFLQGGYSNFAIIIGKLTLHVGMWILLKQLEFLINIIRIIVTSIFMYCY